MAWRVLSWSEVSLPLLPFEAGYAVAVVEGEAAERRLCHVRSASVGQLAVDLSGEVMRSTICGQPVWEFVPTGTEGGTG